MEQKMNKEMMKEMCELMSGCCGEDWKKVEGTLREVCESMCLNLPWCCYEEEGTECGGLSKSEGLWLRCLGSVESEGLCKKCKKSCRVSEGEPRLGLWKKRFLEGSEFKAVHGKVKTWGMYLKEKGKTKEDGLKILKLRGMDSSKVPESEWVTVLKSKKRSGMGITARFVPKKGKSRSVSRKSGNYFKHVGLETGCQVHFNKESGKVNKISSEKWPEEAHAKFVEMYGEPDENGFGTDKPKKKEKVTSNNEMEFAEIMRLERAKMAAELEAEKEKLRLEFEEKLRTEIPPAPESKTSLDPPESNLPKKKKLKIGKKNSAARRAAVEKFKVKEEEKRLAEAKKKEEEIAMKLKEEEEKKHKETTEDTSASELDDDEFDESDDEEGFVFNPYEYNGIKYHLDDGELYHFPPNEEGEVLQYGTLHEDGTVTEM